MPLASLNESEAKRPLALSSKHGLRKTFFFTEDYGVDVSVAMADGSVKELPLGILSAKDLRKALQVDGCWEDESFRRGLFNDPECRLNWPNIAALAVWLLSVGALLIEAVRSRKPQSLPPPPA